MKGTEAKKKVEGIYIKNLDLSYVRVNTDCKEIKQE